VPLAGSVCVPVADVDKLLLMFVIWLCCILIFNTQHLLQSTLLFCRFMLHALFFTYACTAATLFLHIYCGLQHFNSKLIHSLGQNLNG